MSMNSPTSGNSSNSSPQPPPLLPVNRLWDLITAPSAGVQGSEKRRQAQLLATLLLILIVLSPISLVIIQHYGDGTRGSLLRNSSSVLVIIAIAALLICYALSRTRHYLIAAGFAMLIAPVAIFSAIIVSPADNF